MVNRSIVIRRGPGGVFYAFGLVYFSLHHVLIFILQHRAVDTASQSNEA